MEEQIIKQIYCHDGCLVPIIVKRYKTGWRLYGPSEIYGMGATEYKNKIFKFDFINLVALNSFDGKAYVCLNKNNKWGLLEITNNDTVACDLNLKVDFIYDDMDKMLLDMKIKKEDYLVDKDYN